MQGAFLYHSLKENYSNMLHNIGILCILFFLLIVQLYRWITILSPDNSDEALKIMLIIAGVTIIAVFIVMSVLSLLKL